MHVQYLQLAPEGQFHLLFRDIQLNPRHSIIQAEIVSPDLSLPTSYTLAIFTMGDLNSRSGISMKLPPIPTPNREQDCGRWTNGFFYYMNPTSSVCRCYNPKDGPDIMWSPSVGRNRREQWNKLDNGSNFSLEHLGVLGDMVRISFLHM
jgi:hypothetical protein